MRVLEGKKILMVGGNGYVGSYLSSRFIRQNAKVSVLSRKGPKYQYPENKKINWLIGSIQQAQRYKRQINDCQVIVHSVGTLIDTSITKLRQKGQAGTYQQMNVEAFRSLLNLLDSKKQIFYLSAVGRPPFIHRYSDTKEEAERLLLQSDHEGYIIKPGFIHNLQHRKWSIPLRYAIDGWRKVYPSLYSIAPHGTLLQTFMKEFQQGEPTPLKIIGDSVIQIIRKGSQSKIITNQIMRQHSSQYEGQLGKNI